MKSSKLTRLFSTAAVLGALAMPAVADGHEEGGIHIPGASAEVTLDYVTQYFFRGYEQLDSDQGVVIQPGASFTIPVVENVTATVGTWGSIHTDTNDAATSSPSFWYEQDVYGSIDATIGDVSMGVGLTLFSYPALTSNDVLELNLNFSYDDSELLGDFAFNPYANFAIELNNSNANSANNDESTYLELGGAFTLPTEGTVIEDWSWEVPFAFGLSLDDYYNDSNGGEEFLGYFSVGLSGSIALAEVIGYDEWFGAWDLSVGFTVFVLNSSVTAGGGNAFGLTDATGGSSDNIQYVATVGISREW